MNPKDLPVEGCPHISLAGQGDETLQWNILAGLRAAGFTIKSDRVVPPPGAKSQDVITTISNAFREAKRNTKA